MFKIIKVYLKNSEELNNEEIYCIRLNFNEEFEGLKNKVSARCPQVKIQEAQIYWFDLENDKIRITCDDDLKFFMEESPCHKLIFNFGHKLENESSRKRAIDDSIDAWNSKKIRKQLEKIDLSSDSSAMETDDDGLSSSSSSSSNNSKNGSATNISNSLPVEMIPSTSAQSECAPAERPNVEVLSIEIIKEADKPEKIEIPDDNNNDNESQAIPVIEEPVETAQDDVQQSSEQEPKKNASNRIVISDSSDEETEENVRNNRRHSDGPSASAYAYTNVNGNGFESRSSFSGGRYQHSHRFRRGHQGGHQYHSFQEQRREFQRRHAENMDRFHEHARMARDHAARAFRASTSVIPDLVSTFQSHFRPMFRVADINQNIFGRR